jgi:hypothetical protein
MRCQRQETAGGEIGGAPELGTSGEGCGRTQRCRGGPSTSQEGVSCAAALETISCNLWPSEGPKPGH